MMGYKMNNNIELGENRGMENGVLGGRTGRGPGGGRHFTDGGTVMNGRRADDGRTTDAPSPGRPSTRLMDDATTETASETIRFYRSNERPFGVFSNLYRRPMTFDGAEFPHAEAAYQAGKAREPAVRAWILAAPKPHLLAMAAHGLLSWDIAPGWSQGRRDRMRRVVEAKFREHDDLAAVLLGTGDARLAESATVDNEVNRRWGEVRRGEAWVGQNWLGEILMEVREALRGERAAREAAVGDVSGPPRDDDDRAR